MIETPKDVFIIHSKSEPYEEALVSRLIEWLIGVGITVYEYTDWQWSKDQPGKVRYSSSGSNLDPIRYAMGHPQPFRRQTKEQVPDRYTLGEMLGRCRVVAFIAPRSGSPSPGVSLEREVLPDDPAVVLATWGDQNDRLIRHNRHGYLYQIAATFDPEQEKAALDLAHIVCFHWTLDYLAREGNIAGRKLLQELARMEPKIQRILRFSGRISALLGKQLDEKQPYVRGDLKSTFMALADSMPADEIRPSVRHWWQRARIQASLPLPPSREVAWLVALASETIEYFCDEGLRRNPELIEDKAAAIRLGANYSSALGYNALAMQHFNDALKLPGLSNAAQSRVLADRAAMTLRSSPSAARTDIEAILTLSGASETATAQALWLRALQRVKRGKTAAAISDLSEALAIPEITPIIQAVCLHERAILLERSDDREQALQDLDEALRIPGLPAEIVGPALLDRGVLHGDLGNVDDELADYSQTIDLEGVPDETRLKAHMYRGLALMEHGDRLGAVKDFVVVRDDKAAPPEAKQAAIQNLDIINPLK